MNKVNPVWFYIAFLLQLADGFNTYIGVNVFGPIAEGNPLVKFLIVSLGAFPALFLAKGIGCWLLIMAHKLEKEIAEKRFYANCMKVVCAIYLYACLGWFYAFWANWEVFQFS